MKKVFCILLACLFLWGCSKQAPRQETQPATETTQPTEAPAEPVSVAQQLQQRLEQTPDPTVYQVTLTAEQTESFASGQYFLLMDAGADQYLPFYFSSQVKLEGNHLQAQYNGKLPYMVNQGGQCYLPSVVEEQTKDGLTQYTFEVMASRDGLLETYSIYAVCNRETGKIIHTAVLPYGQTPQEDLFTGNTPQPEIPQAEEFMYTLGAYYQPVQDENGALLPINQWQTSGSSMYWTGQYDLQLAYGRLSTVLAPLTMPNIYMVFQWKDQAGNAYGSELLPVTVVQADPVEKPPLPPLQLQWQQGNRLLLFQEQGVSAYLCKISKNGNIGYQLQAYNGAQQEMRLVCQRVIWNGVYDGCVDSGLYMQPEQWEGDYGGWPYPGAVALGEMTKVQTLSFDVILHEGYGNHPVFERNVQVSFVDEAAIGAFDGDWQQWRITSPWAGFLAAPNQTLLDDSLRVSLVGLGINQEEYNNNPCVVYRVENTGDTQQRITLLGVEADGQRENEDYVLTVQPHAVAYIHRYIQNLQPESVSQIQVGLQFRGQEIWYPVAQ